MTRQHVAVLMFCCLTFAAAADVRPISDAERAAVQYAAEYLAGGPPALVPRVASASPLRAMQGALLEAELETRLGPPAGATWQLITVVEALKDKTAAFEVSYASGIDDTIFFDLVQEGGQYRIKDVRMLAMPVPTPPLFPEAPRVEEKGPSGHELDTAAGIGGIAAAVLAFLTVFVMPFRRGLARVMFLVAFVLGAGAVGLAGWKGERFRVTVASKAEEEKKKSEKTATLSDLVVLRSALAAGGEGVGVALADLQQRDGMVGDVAKLWRAQWQFRQGNLDEVGRALASFPLPSRIPLVEVMRARLALARNDSVGAAVAYQRAVNLGPGRDALWLEATTALALAGFEAEAKKELMRVARLGSREASIYYMTASLATEAEDTETLLQRAWTLQPAERSRLVASGVIWSLMRRRGPTMINLSEPHEATLASPAASSRAIALPSTATAAISGELLHIAANDAELFVPNGACLAPAGTRAVDAGQWSRAGKERSLRDVPALLASPPPLASYMQPALRDRIVAAATVLTERNRWNDVVTLTQGISVKSEYVPEDLFFLRATALQHLGRNDEAKGLLLELAGSPVLDRKKDASVLEQLGDMLASYDQYDRALALFERARAIRGGGYPELRLVQIAMDKKLATQYMTYKSPNFEIRYPPEVSVATAAGIGQVLEGELRRLQRWIPLATFRPVIVNIVWWHDFKSVYTGSEDILGFYTGKITLPLAGIWDLGPEIVSLITHELAHAMLAQATNDQAPRWMHEGLAQRVEMVPYSANAFNMYEDDKLLAVSVLDAVLSTSRDGDMVGAAYIVSETFVRYLEASLGEQGLKALIARYAQGATTEEAVAAVAGKSLADVDAAFRTWGKAEKRVFANPAPVRYDQGLVGATEQPQRRERGTLGKGTLYPFRGGKEQQ